jgi:HlyD family secretion protein
MKQSRKGLILALLPLLVACHHDKKQVSTVSQSHQVTVKKQAVVHDLYFTGIVQPIRTTTVFSPVEGRVKALHFDYGETLKTGQLLAVINSTKLMDDIRTAVSDYLTKKASYLNEKESFQGTSALYKAGVIDQENYDNQHNQYQNSMLSFYQERYQLQKVLAKANIPIKEIEQLHLGDIDKIKQVFNKQYNHVKIISPSSGVALFPLQSSDNSSSGDGSVQVALGSDVHEGQLIVSVGDLSGLVINVLVSEADINQIHRGVSAIVTGKAFPGIQLKGSVSYVASQAQPSTGDSSPGQSQFQIKVTVPHITQQQLKRVHVGMSVKVKLMFKQPAKLWVPLCAIRTQQGQPHALAITSSGQQQWVPVVVGRTTMQLVEIRQGLHEGQRVICHDSAKKHH